MKASKMLSLSLILCLGVFVINGYLLSDDFFFSQLIRANHIATPEQAFKYVGNNTYYAGALRPSPDPTPGLSPRYMLTERKYLWCDEGAIVLATINNKLGYETRLVDVIGEDREAHHTYLEVLENGEWKTYDTVNGKAGLTHREILDEYADANLKGFPRPRTYPRWYHWLVQNNFYIKHFELKLRGIPG